MEVALRTCISDDGYNDCDGDDSIVIMTMGSGRRERVGAAGQERERGCERCLEDVYRVGRNAGHVQDVSQYVLSSKSRSTRSGGGGGERG